jgi:ABC-type transport system substrate-binding protein
MKRRNRFRTLGAGGCALVVAAALAACGSTSSSSSSSGSSSNAAAKTPAAVSGSVLTVESSQQNSITQNFNPYVPSSAASLLGATSLIYEPLLQANALKPGTYYNWLATGYSWSHGGDSITFTIRSGVKSPTSCSRSIRTSTPPVWRSAVSAHPAIR